MEIGSLMGEMLLKVGEVGGDEQHEVNSGTVGLVFSLLVKEPPYLKYILSLL